MQGGPDRVLRSALGPAMPFEIGSKARCGLRMERGHAPPDCIGLVRRDRLRFVPPIGLDAAGLHGETMGGDVHGAFHAAGARPFGLDDSAHGSPALVKDGARGRHARASGRAAR